MQIEGELTGQEDLVIDGHWVADPHNQYKQVNDYGELNSVVVVPGTQDAL